MLEYNYNKLYFKRKSKWSIINNIIATYDTHTIKYEISLSIENFNTYSLLLLQRPTAITITMEHHADYAEFDSSLNRKDALESLIMSYTALAESQSNWVANLANCSSLLYHCYNNAGVNWAGFYVVDVENPDFLILGPFMGKVACQSIKIGNGVCGTAASTLKTQLVPNVEDFPGHIACDGMTKSEIVVPIVQNNKLIGVIDLDCTELNGFTEVDQKYLEELAVKIAETCKF